jgi:hypothetical protein
MQEIMWPIFIHIKTNPKDFIDIPSKGDHSMDEKNFKRRFNESLNSLNQGMGILKTSLKAVYTEAKMAHTDRNRYNTALENVKTDFSEFLIRLEEFERLTFY